MAFWLVKSEPNSYSIDDLKRDGVTAWNVVRNFQARSFLREMKVDEEVLFYHSVVNPIGIAGICRVARVAYPDPSQYERTSEYYDSKVPKDTPRWYSPDLAFLEAFQKTLRLEELKSLKGLEGMELLRRGSRLSVQPVTSKQFSIIIRYAREN